MKKIYQRQSELQRMQFSQNYYIIIIIKLTTAYWQDLCNRLAGDKIFNLIKTVHDCMSKKQLNTIKFIQFNVYIVNHPLL